jgi:hypothetical protein
MLRILWSCLAIGLAIGIVSSAEADPGDPWTPGSEKPGTSVNLDSSGDGVTIYIGVTDSSPGSPGDPGSSSGGADYTTWSCTADVMNIGQATLDWFLKEAPKHPGEAPWIVRCNNETIDIVWLPMNTQPPDIQIIVGPGEPVDPVTIALELRDHVPVPTITVGVNPGVGLVAVRSWFWVEGYDGAPIRTSETLGGTTVEVEITPTGYRWTFGDGATLETNSLGQPYPSISDIQHAYEQSSLSSNGAFEVALTINFAVQYRINGGAWQALDPITRSFASAYPVQQLQSILTGR